MKKIGVYYMFPGRTQILVKILKAEGIDAEPVEFSIKKLFSNIKYDKVILTILYGKKSRLIIILLQTLLWRLCKKKTIRFWVGTDVLHASENKKMRFMFKIFDKMADLNIAEAPWFVEELKRVKIKSAFVPLIMPKIEQNHIESLPERCTILSYLPTARQEFYGSKIVIKLAREFPEIKFIIIANDGENLPELKNIEYLGWVTNMDKIYDQTSILLRMPEHDGLSGMIFDALARRRYVICSVRFPGCCYAKDYEDVKKYVNAILKRKNRLSHEIPAEINEYYEKRNRFIEKQLS
ncbi:hypothetical protein K8R14_02705 [bacterium]|nr:hypothetical protein [bacterium]